MLVTGIDSSIQLDLVGYETELGAGEVRGPDDWLALRAVASDVNGRFEYQGVSLDVAEVLELTAWLVAVSSSVRRDLVGQMLFFTEPDMAVQLIEQAGAVTTTRWYFHDEAGTVRTIGPVTVRCRAVDVAADRHEYLAASSDIASSLNLIQP